MTHPAQHLHWRTSSYSGGQGQCVEVAPLPAYIALRDSKRPDLPAFRFPSAAWSDLTATLRR